MGNVLRVISVSACLCFAGGAARSDDEPFVYVRLTAHPDTAVVGGKGLTTVAITFTGAATVTVDPSHLESALTIRRWGVPEAPERPLTDYLDKTPQTRTVPEPVGLERSLQGLSIEYHAGVHFDASRLSVPGIYEIAYRHPWPGEQPVSVECEPILIALLEADQAAAFEAELDRDPALALASYRFRHPEGYEFGEQMNARNKPLRQLLDRVPLKGLPAEHVFYLLGPPQRAPYWAHQPDRPWAWTWNLGVTSLIIHFSPKLRVVAVSDPWHEAYTSAEDQADQVYAAHALPAAQGTRASCASARAPSASVLVKPEGLPGG